MKVGKLLKKFYKLQTPVSDSLELYDVDPGILSRLLRNAASSNQLQNYVTLESRRSRPTF
jgi:hypothetical protein